MSAFVVDGTRSNESILGTRQTKTDKTFGIIGIQAELYYIHDGKVNHNAVAFLARVQPDHSVLKYMWKVASLEVQVPYDIELVSMVYICFYWFPVTT